MTFNVQGDGSNELQGVPTRPRDFGGDADVPVDDVEYDVWDARGAEVRFRQRVASQGRITG